MYLSFQKRNCMKRIMRVKCLKKVFFVFAIKAKKLTNYAHVSQKFKAATCFSLTLAIVLLFYWMCAPQEDVIEMIKKNAFNKEFSGATSCGKFPCFGETLCGTKGLRLIHINSSTIFGVNNWLQIRGITKNRYRKNEKIVLNYPLVETCSSITCKVRLRKSMFSLESYQVWICRNFGFNDNCDVTTVLHDWPRMRQILKETGRLKPYVITDLSPPLRCPSPRLADRLLRRVLGSRGKGSTNLKDYTYPEKAELILMSKLSPEFIMQKLFPPQEGWATNRGVGVCGLMTINRVSVEETLFDLYHKPWKMRIDLAVQLLDLAHMYSENDFEYILLLHQLTPHDLGIDESGQLRIRNSNNIIIVDAADSSRDFSSKPFEAPYNRYKFEIPDNKICSVNRTDVNFYTVCRRFLSGSWKGLQGETLTGGLLHDPEALSHVKSELSVLLDLCTRGSIAVPKDHPRSNMLVRKVAAKHLRRLLASERSCGPLFAYRYPECDLMNN